jgi:methionyl-tRNA formyltransferase
MVRDMDAGDIILQRAVKIGKTEDAAALYDRLAQLGGELVVEAVAQIQAGTAAYTPQDHTQATQAPMLSKAMSPVDWTRSAQEIFNQIRGLYPWPGASTTAITGEPIKLWTAQVAEQHTDALPGTVIAAAWGGIDVACGDGQVLRILELQAPGKKRMSVAAYLAGNPIQV